MPKTDKPDGASLWAEYLKKNGAQDVDRDGYFYNGEDLSRLGASIDFLFRGRRGNSAVRRASGLLAAVLAIALIAGVSTAVQTGIISGDIAVSGKVSGKLTDAGGQVFNVKAPPYNAKGDGSTDDTAAIQSAIADAASGNGVVFFPAGTFNFTHLDVRTYNGTITLKGAQGYQWWGPDTASQGRSILHCTATNAADGIAAFQIQGLIIQDIQFSYVTGYTGTLIQLGGTAGVGTNTVLIDRCHFISNTTGSYMTAKTFIGMSNVVCVTVRDCSFMGAASLIRGVETANNFSNVVIIERCQFERCTVGQIVNPLLQWYIRDCTFEYTSTAPYGITSDITDATSVSGFFTFIDVTGCSFWDASQPNQVPIYQPAGMAWDIRVSRCWFHVFNNVNISLNGPGNVLIDGNTFISAVPVNAPTLIDLGPSSTAFKDNVNIIYNWWQAIPGVGGGYDDLVILNRAGHNIGHIAYNSGNGADGRDILTVSGQERLGYGGGVQNVPTAVAHTGQSLGTITCYGNDTGGIIKIVTGGSPTVVGALVDVTFSKPYLPFPLSSGIDANHRMVAVQLTPYETPEGSGVDAVNAGVYVKTAYATQTGFTICTKNAVAASTTILFSYRVIQI
jgi:hypothetical protein